MKKLTRLLVVALFAALIVGSVTSFKAVAVGVCENCTTNAEVKKCNGFAAEVTPAGATPSGNCITAEAAVEKVDTNNDGTLDDVHCVITTYYSCQAGTGGGTDQGCGLMQSCGGQ